MLRIFGLNGFVEEFWGLVESMKNIGYGISKGVREKVLEKFEKEGLDGDDEKLRAVFDSGSIDKSETKISSRVCRIIRNEVWGDDVEKQLRDLNVTFSSDMVKMILGSLSTDPTKALILFRWLEESGLFKHDQQTYNAMARVLGREDCLDRFQKIVEEMKSFQFEIEGDTFTIVLGRFWKRRMIEEAVNLYEFAMAGPNKPSANCGTFLLKRIVMAKSLDMSLFSRAVKIFTNGGNVLTDSMLDAIIKSLTSVGRTGKCATVLEAMEEGGYVAGDNMRSKIVSLQFNAGKKDAAVKFVDNMELSRYNLDWKTWKNLIQGLCRVGDLDEACNRLRKMIKSEGVGSAGAPIDSIVAAYCRRNKAVEACKLLHNLASETEVRPWHRTYQMLITSLLAQRGFSDALKVLGLMKGHGFPPFIDPFIEYVSKSGTGDDAIDFLKATSKRFSSSIVFLRVFEAYFKAGRHNEAQDFLAKCPSFIRNHPDVLNLFLSKKPAKDAGTATSPLAA
ncbi:hypothetical protein TIFTF001_026721 [Ficus carica]|uniref:Pentatricopeptide repeat-containing protein n=1 Tax=Ficus carica TaxID=3494 RepID=A0AA88DLR0_FICCA|nr:hypothetical protein TIFTF001_026721 [Ficus carica]